MLFDSHSHLYLFNFDNDREEIIKKLRLPAQAGDFSIKTINVGTDFEESKKAIKLSNQNPDVLWASVGLHPNDNLEEVFDIDKYRELAKNDCVVAIGECGLDYYRSPSKEEIARQKEIFEKQIELAKELNKPLVLHCRPSIGTQDAYEDVINILNTKYQILNTNGGVVHFFSGSKETAKKFMDLGFYISFAGPITFAPEYREVVEFVPLDKILIETDAPFASPRPHRGKRNEPAFVEFVARKIGEWKGLDFDKVATQTHNNAKALFKI
ncbi:MAG: TatD family hydrolase [Patescibacteria group bacterium]